MSWLTGPLIFILVRLSLDARSVTELPFSFFPALCVRQILHYHARAGSFSEHDFVVYPLRF